MSFLEKIKDAVTPGGEKHETKVMAFPKHHSPPPNNYDGMSLGDRVKAAVTPGGEQHETKVMAFPKHHSPPANNYNDVGAGERVKSALTPGGEKFKSTPHPPNRFSNMSVTDKIKQMLPGH